MFCWFKINQTCASRECKCYEVILICYDMMRAAIESVIKMLALGWSYHWIHNAAWPTIIRPTAIQNALHYISLHLDMHCATFQCTAICIVLHFTALRYALHYISVHLNMHCATFHCIAICTGLHFTALQICTVFHSSEIYYSLRTSNAIYTQYTQCTQTACTLMVSLNREWP